MTRRKPFLFLWTLSILALAGPAFAQSAVLPSGATGWWPAEDSARDAVGTYHGTVESGVTYAPGKVGKAFSFNGLANGGGVNLGNVPAFDFTPTSSFTLEAWINSVGATVGPNDGQNILILNYNCSSTLQALAINSAEKAFFSLRDTNDAGVVVVSPEPLSKNAWHHVAGVREATASGKTLKLYVDGVLAGSVADSTTGGLAMATSDLIGRRNPCGTNNTFKGFIDEPAVYNRALTAQEIAGIFQAGSAGKVTSLPPKLISGAVTTYTEDQPGVAVDAAVTIENDEPSILLATATITDIRDAGKESLAASTEGTAIHMEWVSPRLILEGTDTLANYQKVLRSITYRNDSQAPDASVQRHVELMVRDAGYESNRLTRAVNVVSVNDPPVAGDDRFALIGNTVLQVDESRDVVSVRTTNGGKGLLANDADPAENQTLRVVGVVGCADEEAPFSCPTANGNTVDLQASGTFSVTPAGTGDSGPGDSFQYRVSDGEDSVIATVTLDRTGRVWYVKNDDTGPGPIGTSNRPFRTLKEAEAASQPGDTIYVFEGNGTSAGLNAGIELRAGQRLIGAGQDLAMPWGSGEVVLRAKVAAPRVENTGGSAVLAAGVPAEIGGLILQGSTDGVRIAAGAEAGAVLLRDVEIRAAAGTGLRVTGGGSGPLDTRVTVSGGSIFAQGGAAVDIEGAKINIQLAKVESLGSGSAGISLIEASGPFSVGAGSRIEGSAGGAVHVEGGEGDFSFGGTISGGASGHSVLVRNRAAGRASFSGSIADNGAGIRLEGAGAVSFSGGLTLRPAAGESAFVAEGGGSVTVTGSANTVVASGGGQALSIRGTEIGAAGLTFQSLSASGAGGAEAAIHLEGTGTAGGLTVTGSGAAGSGGTIAGRDGAAIALSGTARVSLASMTVQGNAGGGIRGSGVGGLSLSGCSFQGNGVGASAADGLFFENLSGAVTIASTEVSGSGRHGVRIANSAGVLSPLSVSGSQLVDARGGYGLFVEAQGTATVDTVSLTGSTFSGSPSGLKLSSSGTGRISGVTTATSTFLGGATLELSAAQMAALTCSP